MPIDIKVPSVGESITEGTLSRWFKQDGEIVRADEAVFELETEKATTQVAAPAAGRVHILVAEGQTVAIGTVVGQIEETADATATPPPAPNAAPVSPSQPGSNVAALPAARRLAEEKGVDLHTVTGSGRGGRITKEDVQEASGGRKPPEEDEVAFAEGLRPSLAAERKPMTRLRQTIAARLLASQKATASLTTFNEADMSAILALRSQYRDRFKEKHGAGLGFMSFFVKAAVAALRAFPVVNSYIDGTDIVTPQVYNIGIAVSSDRGLFVPVLRSADQMSFAQIEKAIEELAQKARAGKIALQDLQDGTFTITNGGVFGSLLSTPILNPPQSAILGMHTIQKRPVAVNDQVVIRPMMYLALTYDHRLIDGREAVLFLVRIKECIEQPERLLLEV